MESAKSELLESVTMLNQSHHNVQFQFSIARSQGSMKRKIFVMETFKTIF